MAPTPPDERPTGSDRDPNRSGFHDRFGARGPNPITPPAAKPPPALDGDDDFDKHVAPSEPPRPQRPKGAVIAVAAGALGVLLCGGLAAGQAFGEPEQRVTFTVTHVPEPRTTTATETQTETRTATATKTVDPSKKKRAAASRSSAKRSSSSGR